jgi:antitoxin CptB
VEALIDERALSRLKWACRRGLLENELFIDGFFQRHEHTLSVREADGLRWLMDLSDNDLLDLLLRRSELPSDLGRPEVNEVLGLMRRPAPEFFTEGRTP